MTKRAQSAAITANCLCFEPERHETATAANDTSTVIEPRGINETNARRQPFVTTNDGLTFTITLVAALGCGLMAGLFFAFSAAVMKALARLPSAEGIGAMQSINVAIINPLFLAVFFGTAVACVLVIIIASLLRWHEPGTIYLLIGGALYLVGTFLVLDGRFRVTQLAHLVSRDPPRITSRIDKSGLALFVRLICWRGDALGSELNRSAVDCIYVINVDVGRPHPG